MGKKYITVSELRAELRVSRTTAYRLTRQPDFPSYKVGKGIRIDTDKLDDWLKGNKVTQ